MSEWLKVIILGIVEGLTEFLPVSSTGHLIVTSALLDFQTGLAQGTFEIFIQLGAVLAVVVYYRKALLHQVVNVRTDRRTQRLWLAIFVAFLPAAVIGMLLKDWVKAVLFSPLVVALALIVGGVMLIVIERRKTSTPPAVPTAAEDMYSITFRQAFMIGVAQVFAFLFPGFSRSGAAIIAGMLGGMNRRAATEFSFLLAIPTLGGATVVDLATSIDEVSTTDMLYLLVGTVISGIVAWIAIRWLLRYVATHSFVPFGYYRIVVGIIIFALVALAVIA